MDQLTVREQIIDEIISPIFKKWGFKKKRTQYVKTEGDAAKIFTVFSSQWNDKNNVSFTFELKIIKNEQVVAETRIGHLKIKTDYWYVLNKSSNVESVKAEIASDILKYAKPFFDKY